MKSFLNIRVLATIAAVLALAAPAMRSMADDDDSVTPSKTTVLLLPVLDATGDGHMGGLHTAILSHRMEYEFITRQFTIIGPSMGSGLVQKAGLSATDITQRTTDQMAKMAQAAGADWVVSIVCLEFKHDTFTPGNRTDDVKVHLLVYDAKGGDVLADKDVVTTKNSAGQNIGVLGLICATLDAGAQETLKNLLSAYPETVKVENEGGTEDYFYGQTKPVTGDPKKPFTDLNMPPPAIGTVQAK